jgi:hypothetical protein
LIIIEIIPDRHRLLALREESTIVRVEGMYNAMPWAASNPDFQIVSSADEQPNWWPADSADPRKMREWAVVSRSDGDNVGFLGVSERCAFWIRRVNSEQGPTRKNVVDVCSGLDCQVPAPKSDIDAARVAYPRQLLAVANGVGTPVITNRTLSDYELDRLVAALVECAAESDAVPAVLHVPVGEPVLGVLRRRGFFVGISGLYPTIELPGDSFEDYLNGLLRSHRKMVRREVRMASGADRRILVGREAESRLENAAELVQCAYRSRGQSVEHAEVVDRYRRFVRILGDRFALSLVSVDGVPVASTTLVRGRDELLAYNSGFKPEYSRKVAGYFNSMYYCPIEYAYANKIRRIRLGSTTLTAKTWRGATLTPMCTAVPGSCTELVRLLRQTDQQVRSFMQVDQAGRNGES